MKEAKIHEEVKMKEENIQTWASSAIDKLDEVLKKKTEKPVASAPVAEKVVEKAKLEVKIEEPKVEPKMEPKIEQKVEFKVKP
jgi:hypothetical protein